MKILFIYILAFAIYIGSINAQSKDHITKLKEFNDLANAAQLANNLDKLVEFNRQAFDYAKANLDKKDTLLYHTQCDYGYALIKKGLFTEAEVVLSDAQKSAEALLKATDEVYTDILGIRAMNFTYWGNYEMAESLYKKNILLLEASGKEKTQAYAQVINNLAVLYAEQKRYEEAEPLYLVAMKIRKDTLGIKHPFYGQSLNNLAVLYRWTERHSEAEKMYLENLSIQKNISESSYALALNNLAVYYSATKQVEKALPLFKESAAVRKRTVGTDHPDFAHSLNNLGRAYEFFKDYEKAEKCYLEAAKIREKSYSAQSTEVLETYNNLAFVYFYSRQFDEMWNYIFKSLKNNGNLNNITKEVDEDWSKIIEGAEFANIYYVFPCLSLYLSDIKEQLIKTPKDLVLLKKALRISKTALVLEEKMRRSFSSEADKLRVVADLFTWTQRAIEFSAKIAELNGEEYSDAFLYAERNKSLSLLNAMKSQRARNFGDLPDSLVQKEQALQKELNLLKKQVISIRDEDQKAIKLAKLNKLTSEANDFQKKLENNYPKYYKLKYSSQNLKTEEVQKILPKNTALLEYYISDSSIYIFTLTNKSIYTVNIELGKDILKNRIKDFRKSLSDYEFIKNKEEEAYALYCDNAYWFYQQFLSPALSKLKDIDNLIIIPDGELGHLPFEAFLTEKPVNNTAYAKLPYLLKRFKVSYNYSATLWLENLAQGKKNNNGKLFAAAPSYAIAADSIRAPKVRDPNLTKLRDALMDLPAARAEVNALSKQFSGRFLLGTEATEALFKSEAGEYAIIHLAMHGLMNTQYPILSSLAFSENSDSLEDNFLQAYEISQMKLNAQLVVLSACETGYGNFLQGEGVISLARSFMYSGVPSLVVSLWQVNDISTSTIMRLFYKNLAKGMDKAAALQQAKLEYIGGGGDAISPIYAAAHPAFWAAFVQLGDSRPIKVHQHRSGSYFIWASALVAASLLLFAVLFLIRSKGNKHNA